MNPIDKIRDHRRSEQLQQLLVMPHRARIVHLYNIRSVGIITLSPSKEDETTLEQFWLHMKQNGSNVMTLTIPPNIDQKLDKNGLPQHDIYNKFAKYHFDILINATPIDNIYGLYITLESSCNLRVAYQDTTLPTQDFILSAYDLIIRKNVPMDLFTYLTDLLTILQNIRKKTKGNLY